MSHTPLRVLALIAVVAVAGSSSRVTVAGQTARPLSILSRGPIAVPRAAPALDPWELRARQVSLNTNALAAGAAGDSALAAIGQVSIDLFDGASVTAVLDRYDPNATGVTWVGHVPGQPESLVTIVYGGGALAASVILNDASYTIRPVPQDSAAAATAADGTYLLVQTNPAGFLRGAPPIEVTPSRNEAAAAADEVMADTGEFIDVMVAYTAQAESWAGGPAGIVNWINVAVSETNSTYAASGVDQRIRLVHTVRVAYTEVNSLGTNLTNLRAGAGGGLEKIAQLRDSYTADLVSLFVRPTTPDFCGIAFLMPSLSSAFAPNAFNVVFAPCASPNAFAHELGHNMGLRHDWYMDNGVTPFTYAHGYVNTVARFRTVMSYPDSCTALGLSCTWILRFSNPDLIYLGQPGGIPGGTKSTCPMSNATNMSCDADERRALNETAFVVSNFRQYSELRPPTIVAQPQNQTVRRGQALTLQVSADGVGPLTYQWYRGAAPLTTQPIPGGTGPSVTFTPGADGVWFERGRYWVQVGNAVGTEDSFTATVTMLPPATGSSQSSRRAAAADPVNPIVPRGHGGADARPQSATAPPPVVASSGRLARPPAVSIDGMTNDGGACHANSQATLQAWLHLIDATDDAPSVIVALARLATAIAEGEFSCGERGPR